VLEKMGAGVLSVSFQLFSQDLTESDASLLRNTLEGVGKPFSLELRRLDERSLFGFPKLHGSLAPYYRLLAISQMDVDRLLYLDSDTLCDLDLSPLQELEMSRYPAAWVTEAPLSGAVDRLTAMHLGNSPDEPYFNSGVILVNVLEWKRQAVSQKALEYIAQNKPLFHDQSALNVVLSKNAITLDMRYNTISNMRKHWPKMSKGIGRTDSLIHFVDYPKPWDLGAELIHPHYLLWRSVLEKTAIKDFRSWHDTPARKAPRTPKAKIGYQKAIKDKLLFTGYIKGWIKNVKGIGSPNYR
jgi:lipopolysaccharide biosynthesis glycosyltransferase